MWCREEAHIFIFLQPTIETRNSAPPDWAVVSHLTVWHFPFTMNFDLFMGL